MARIFYRCNHCGKRLGLAIFVQRHVWCPQCDALLLPKCVQLGPAGRAILELSKLDSHPESASRLFGMLALVALSCGATELIFKTNENDHHIVLSIGDDSYELIPPPEHLVRMFVQVAAAIAGLDASNTTGRQRGEVILVVPDARPQEWRMFVDIDTQIQGTYVIFTFPAERIPNTDMLEDILNV